MEKAARVFLVNLIFLTFGYVGLSVMDRMSNAERVASYNTRVNAYNEQVKKAAERSVSDQMTALSKGYSRCTGTWEPFLTDHVFIIGSAPASNDTYYSGVVYEVTMKEALAQPKGSVDVIAYCE
jgi:hypothetical protein